MSIKSRFRGFKGILYKEVLQLMRDPIALFFAFFPPLIQVIVFGFAINTDIKHIPAVFYNQDQRRQSREFLDQMRNTQYIDFVAEVHSEKELANALTGGGKYVGIKIPPDFSENLAHGKPTNVLVLIDGSDNTIAAQALNVTSNLALRNSLEELLRESGKGIKDMPLDTRPKILYNPDLRSQDFFVPGVIGVALQLSTIILTAFSVVRERERGTLEQLMVTPLSEFGLLLGKIIPYTVLGFLMACFLFLIMSVVFKVDVAGNVFLLLALTLVFIFTNLSIGLLISSRAKTQTEAIQIAVATLLPSIFLSGYIFPRFTMPDIFYALSFLIPTTYYMNILRGIILRAAGAVDLGIDIIVLSGMGLLLFLLAVKRFKKQIS
ncbi:MAG TPA: ABC transporter permease [Thermodesulfobacteriota bacterium]|nr:ABC transporter permease [Thermodesulfobacteriota bacterium]